MHRKPYTLSLILTSMCITLFLLTVSCTKSEDTRKSKLDFSSKKILVKVNGKPVFEGDVFRRIQATHGDIDKEKIDPNRWAMILESATESEVIDKVILDAAIADGLSVTEEEVRTLLDKSKEVMGKENFDEMLRQRKTTEEEFKNFLRERELVRKYKARLFSSISIGDDEMKEYYDGHRKSFTMPESVRIEAMAVEGQKVAEEIYKRWKKGENFEKLDREYSERLKKNIGTRTRWMPYNAMPMELQSKAREGKAGEILDPILSNDTIYVIKILEKREEGMATFEEAKERIRNKLRRRKEQKIVDEWYTSQIHNVKIEYIK